MGKIIDGLYTTVSNSTGDFYKLSYEIAGISNVKTNYFEYRPKQEVGKESDFTILFNDGKVEKAKLIKELEPFRKWWEDNKVDGFHLVSEHKKYWLGNHDISEGVLSSILKSWTLERQIKTLQTLIELYKD